MEVNVPESESALIKVAITGDMTVKATMDFENAIDDKTCSTEEKFN